MQHLYIHLLLELLHLHCQLLFHIYLNEHIQGIFSEWTLRAAATHKTYHSVLTVSHLLSFVLIIMQLLLDSIQLNEGRDRECK